MQPFSVLWDTWGTWCFDRSWPSWPILKFYFWCWTVKVKNRGSSQQSLLSVVLQQHISCRGCSRLSSRKGRSLWNPLSQQVKHEFIEYHRVIGCHRYENLWKSDTSVKRDDFTHCLMLYFPPNTESLLQPGKPKEPWVALKLDGLRSLLSWVEEMFYGKL